MQLADRFDVETEDAGLERGAHFVCSFAYARKNHLARIAAGRQHPSEFAAGYDIEPRTELGKQVEDGQTGIGFDRIANQMWGVGKCLGIILEGTFKCGSGVDVKGRAEAFGECFQGHTFEMKVAVDSIQGVHLVVRCGAGEFSGRYRSPLEPQPDRASPQSNRDTIVSARNFMREMLARDTMTRIDLDEAVFTEATGKVLAHIEQVLEDADLDFETPADGILEVEFDDGSKIIINRHGVAREIWVAARSGGFHFMPVENGWADTKDSAPLYDKLSALVALQGGGTVRF